MGSAITYDSTRGTESGEERFKKFANNSGVVVSHRLAKSSWASRYNSLDIKSDAPKTVLGGDRAYNPTGQSRVDSCLAKDIWGRSVPYNIAFVQEETAPMAKSLASHINSKGRPQSGAIKIGASVSPTTSKNAYSEDEEWRGGMALLMDHNVIRKMLQEEEGISPSGKGVREDWGGWVGVGPAVVGGQGTLGLCAVGGVLVGSVGRLGEGVGWEWWESDGGWGSKEGLGSGQREGALGISGPRGIVVRGVRGADLGVDVREVVLVRGELVDGGGAGGGGCGWWLFFGGAGGGEWWVKSGRKGWVLEARNSAVGGRRDGECSGCSCGGTGAEGGRWGGGGSGEKWWEGGGAGGGARKLCGVVGRMEGEGGRGLIATDRLEVMVGGGVGRLAGSAIDPFHPSGGDEDRVSELGTARAGQYGQRRPGRHGWGGGGGRIVKRMGTGGVVLGGIDAGGQGRRVIGAWGGWRPRCSPGRGVGCEGRWRESEGVRWRRWWGLMGGGQRQGGSASCGMGPPGEVGSGLVRVVGWRWGGLWERRSAVPTWMVHGEVEGGGGGGAPCQVERSGTLRTWGAGSVMGWGRLGWLVVDGGGVVGGGVWGEWAVERARNLMVGGGWLSGGGRAGSVDGRSKSGSGREGRWAGGGWLESVGVGGGGVHRGGRGALEGLGVGVAKGGGVAWGWWAVVVVWGGGGG
ncbi:hypothetical protein Tco_1459207 [Tanacetum coccineum]